MDLLDIMKKIESDYYHERMYGTFKKNKINFLLNREVKSSIPKSIIGDQYLINGSAGKGNWAIVPWIGIFDKDISDSAKGGFDIVFLFTSDGRGVYLSLNQGWTHFKETYKKDAKASIKKVVDYWRVELEGLCDGFSFEKVDLIKTLENNTNLAKGYEYGDICHKYYDISEITSNEKLLYDLSKLISIFRELKAKMIFKDFRQTIDYILTQNIDFLKEDKDEQSIESANLDVLIKNSREISAPSFRKSNSIRENSDRYVTKRNYLKEARENSKLGYVGEIFVYRLEKERILRDPQLAEFVEKVQHVSKEVGDGLGYDIISLRKSERGEVYPIYIEVKTTSGGEKTPFYLSPKELSVSEEYKDNYYIYRVCNIKKNSISYYTIQGPLKEKLKLIASSYLCYLE